MNRPNILAVFSIAISSVVFAACGTFSLHSSSRQSSRQPSQQSAQKKSEELQVRSYARELQKRQSIIDELKERNLVLEQKLAASKKAAPQNENPQANSPSAASNATGDAQSGPHQVAERAQVLPARAANVKSVNDGNAQEEISLETLKDANGGKVSELQQTGEQRLYSKVLESFRIHNAGELQKAMQILLKTYPDSVYADNALYLAGLLAFEANDMVHSAAYMDRVLREYPRGNKAVSALFAKAMINKRQQNLREAKTILQSIRKLYPGSPEAARSGTEEKIIDLAKSPARADRRID